MLAIATRKNTHNGVEELTLSQALHTFRSWNGIDMRETHDGKWKRKKHGGHNRKAHGTLRVSLLDLSHLGGDQCLLESNIIIYLIVSSASSSLTSGPPDGEYPYLAQTHISTILKHIKPPSQVIHEVDKPIDIAEEHFGSELIFSTIADVFHPDIKLSELEYETK